MIELPKFFNQMSEEAFRRLMGFARLLDFHLDPNIGRAIKRSYALPGYAPEQLSKRLLMLQTFSELRPSLYSLANLRSEKEIKREYPWQWIGLVEEVDLRVARREAIAKLTSKEPDFDHFKQMMFNYVFLIPKGERHLESILTSIARKIPDKKLKELKREVAELRKTKRETE